MEEQTPVTERRKMSFWQRVKERNPEKYEQLKQCSKYYRASLTEEKKKRANEKAKLRMQRYLCRKRLEAEQRETLLKEEQHTCTQLKQVVSKEEQFVGEQINTGSGKQQEQDVLKEERFNKEVIVKPKSKKQTQEEKDDVVEEQFDDEGTKQLIRQDQGNLEDEQRRFNDTEIIGVESENQQIQQEHDELTDNNFDTEEIPETESKKIQPISETVSYEETSILCPVCGVMSTHLL